MVEYCILKCRVSFVNPLLEKATKNPLEVDDIGVIPQSATSQKMHDKFESLWSKECEKPEEKRKLVGTILRAGGASKLFLAGILHCIGELVNLVPTYIIDTLVSDLEEPFLSNQHFDRMPIIV